MKLTKLVKIGKDILFSKKPAQPVFDNTPYLKKVAEYAGEISKGIKDEKTFSELCDLYRLYYQPNNENIEPLPSNMIVSDVLCDVADELMELWHLDLAKTYLRDAIRFDGESVRVAETQENLDCHILTEFMNGKKTRITYSLS